MSGGIVVQSSVPVIETEADFAAHALHEAFGLAGRLEALPGEHDRNFKVTTAEGARYLFKIHGASVAPRRAELQAAVLRHLEHMAPDLPVPRLFLGRGGAMLPLLRDPSGAERRMRLTTWLEGETWADASRRAPDAPESLGGLLARLDRALAGFDHPGLAEPYIWDLGRAGTLRVDVALIADPNRRAAAAAVFDRFAAEVEPCLKERPKQAIHADANDRNVLLDAAGRVSGLLDFGDMVESWRVTELAVAATYAALGSADPIEAVRPMLAAYCREAPIGEAEADALYDLILLRHAVSMVIAARQHREQPDNDYLLISQDALWPSLQSWMGMNRALAVARLREACGLEPVAARRAVERWILQHNGAFGPVLPIPLDRGSLSLLPTGADRDGEGRARPGISYAERLDALLPRLGGTPIGRYGEDRSIYGSADDAAARRTIHLAIDLYAPAGMPVLAPLPGRVAMVGNDTAAEGFGGILVLEHEADAPHRFWTVYGHLAPASLADARTGAAVARGAEIARLGPREQNGGWPPHLHFQILTAPCFDSAEAIFGLAAPGRWTLWESISPDPNQILGLPIAAAARVARDPATLRQQRDRWISRALSLSYDTPLKIVRGEGAALIDETGRRYLDLVNNVCHVGHSHPRVVEAIAAQAAQLNTNTRYLHDNLVEYARRLTMLLPPELSTVFFVNSGSEANDLALRLSLAYSGGDQVVVLDHAYHGNLSSLVDISPYKFNGPGGAGRKRHVWVAEMPDLYRGRIRAGEPDAGRRYADKVAVLLRDMSGLDRRLAAFFVEPLLGCGGQLVLPDGYLAAAFEEVHAAGGVCICDEVQIGFGRVGSHFWGFETQGVVPDIVTMGKPIGNGHPMGAVACRPEIAAAFVSGMEYFNTFGGNPVSAVAGLAVLDVIRDERLMANAAARGAQLHDGLTALAERHPLIGDVRGLGLFMGVELVRDPDTLEPADREIRTIVEAMKAEDILLSTEGPHHNVLKIKPPLAITEAECDRFLDALDRVLARLDG
jgi:4-aminobutyrate aminotransferase-like enzyme/Ser/Thr protein kinase RdoA (MazF antagonist)